MRSEDLHKKRRVLMHPSFLVETWGLEPKTSRM